MQISNSHSPPFRTEAHTSFRGSQVGYGVHEALPRVADSFVTEMYASSERLSNKLNGQRFLSSTDTSHQG